MVALTAIKNYSPEEVKSARKISPALDRYLTLLEKPTTDDLADWRKIRHQSWCEATLATITNKHSCEDICKNWSQKTENLLSKIWQHFQLDQEACILIAMGKWGAEELNLSSDIDLIFVSEGEPTAELNKKIRSWIRAVSTVTDFAFCHRVDLDLRPGGKSASLVTSWDHLTNHYGYAGETWERVAMVRLRPLFGPEDLKSKVLSFCTKFAYRKHIDLRLFNDFYLMRERIQQNIQEKTLNIKYSAGGIRDLELFIHSLQLIHGGKKIKLKTPSTTEAIREIGQHHLIPIADAQFLLETYWFYRDLENKIHCYEDHHTYELKMIDQLISLDDIEKFKKSSQKVNHLLNGFLEPHKPKDSLVSNKDLAKLALEAAQRHSIDIATFNEFIERDVRSRTYERDENERRYFLKNCISILNEKSTGVEIALVHLKSFIANIRAKTSLFSLFNSHPKLVEEILWIFSTSPYLSNILIHRPDLVDSYLLKSSDIDSTDESTLCKSIYDFKLVSELIAASAFLRNHHLQALTENLSQTADTICKSTLDFFLKKFPGISIDILTMGKWSAQEMGLKSDLDFVFIADTEPTPQHFKIARRFVHALQSPPSQPQIYSIDLRLRPSGSSGPLLSQMIQLKDYLETKAMIWERQAYLRTRLLSSNHLPQLFNTRPVQNTDKDLLKAIQNKLLNPVSEHIDLKKSFGGLIQTEFTIQILLLTQEKFPTRCDLQTMASEAIPDSALAQEILKNYQTLRTYHQLLILIADSPDPTLHREDPSFLKLASHVQQDPVELFKHLSTLLKKQDSLLKGLDPLS